MPRSIRPAKAPKAIERSREALGPALLIFRMLLLRRLRAIAKEASGEAAAPLDIASRVARLRRRGRAHAAEGYQVASAHRRARKPKGRGHAAAPPS